MDDLELVNNNWLQSLKNGTSDIHDIDDAFEYHHLTYGEMGECTEVIERVYEENKEDVVLVQHEDDNTPAIFTLDEFVEWARKDCKR